MASHKRGQDYLRFGKKADYLRFGKRADYLRYPTLVWLPCNDLDKVKWFAK